MVLLFSSIHVLYVLYALQNTVYVFSIQVYDRYIWIYTINQCVACPPSDYVDQTSSIISIKTAVFMAVHAFMNKTGG